MRRLIILFSLLLCFNSYAVPLLFKSQSGDYLCQDEGKIQLYGWQLVDTNFDGVGDTWYCFDPDNGKMVTNGWTEEGYYVDENGKWVEALGCARDYSTEGFKFTTTREKFMYKFKDGTSPNGTWVLLSPLKNHVYYWFFFDYNGELSMNQSAVQGKYKTDNYGRWLNKNNEVVSKFIYDDDVSKYTVDATFTDANGVSQGAIIYTGKDIVNNSANDNSVVYTAQASNMTKFIGCIKKDSARKCNFELEDRNFYDEYADDYRGILKKSIRMEPGSSSFQLKTNKYNYFKITYALEYEGVVPGTEENGSARLQVFINGELTEEDPDLYTKSSIQVRNLEIECKKNDIVTISFTSQHVTSGLIMTGISKYRKADQDYIDITEIDNYDNRITGGSIEQYGPGAHIEEGIDYDE